MSALSAAKPRVPPAPRRTLPGWWNRKFRSFKPSGAPLALDHFPEADDLVQDTLVRALASGHLFEPGTNLRAWLVVIMRNAVSDRSGAVEAS